LHIETMIYLNKVSPVIQTECKSFDSHKKYIYSYTNGMCVLILNYKKHY